MGGGTIHSGDGSDTIIINSGDFYPYRYYIRATIKDFNTQEDIIDLTSGLYAIYSLSNMQYEQSSDDLTVILESSESPDYYFIFQLLNTRFTDLSEDMFVFLPEPPYQDAAYILPNEPLNQTMGTVFSETILATETSGEYISALEGDDTLVGEVGDDYLFGGDGDDYLIGNDGNDVLTGGVGLDTLEGGLGNDFYIIDFSNNNNSGPEIIFDEGGVDTIILENVFDPYDVELDFSTMSSLNPNAYMLGLKDFFGGNGWGGLIIEDSLGEFGDLGNGFIEYLVMNDIVYDMEASLYEGDWVVGSIDYGNGNDLRAPVANDDVFYLENGRSLSGNVLSNNGMGVDYDPEGTLLTVNTYSDVGEYGSFDLFSDGSFNITAAAGYSGTQIFSYVVSDEAGNSSSADVTVNFTYVNQTPVAGAMDDTLDVQTGKSFTFNTNFTDSDSILTYSAELVDGSPLPNSIQIDADTGVLSGIFPNVLQDIEIRITASDGLASASHVLTLAVSLLGTDAQDYLHGNDEANVISAEAGDDFVYGYLGDDILSGDDGNDYIYGHEGNDTLDGGTGNDVLFGLQNDDSLYGGTGDDFLYGDDQDGLGTFIDGGNDTLYGGDGDDKLVGGNGNDVLHGGANGDTLFGNDGQDTLNGDNGDDFLYGGDGIDTLQGGAGRDRLAGDQGDDTLYGGDDRDTLFGGDGDDVIRGGTGIDSLYGNDGADTFVYQQGDVDGSRDYILDFSIAQGDTIDISDVIDFSSANGDDITDFVLLGGGSSYVRINIDQDGSGNAHSVQAVAQITNNTGWDLSTLIANGTLVVE